MSNQNGVQILAISTFTILIGMVQPAEAREGGHSGNGGIAAVCRDSNGKVESARLLDILEAEEIDGIQMRSSVTSDEFARAMKLIEAATGSFGFAKAAESYRSRATWNKIGAPFELPDPKDFHPRVGIRGCKFETAVLFYDEGMRVRYDEEILNALPKLDRAAIEAHEIVYFLARRAGATTSDISRLVVGQLFAQTPNLEILRRLYEKQGMRPSAHCTYADTLTFQPRGMDVPFDDLTTLYSQSDLDVLIGRLGLGVDVLIYRRGQFVKNIVKIPDAYDVTSATNYNLTYYFWNNGLRESVGIKCFLMW